MGRGDVMTYLASTFSTMSNIPGNCPSELFNSSFKRLILVFSLQGSLPDRDSAMRMFQ